MCYIRGLFFYHANMLRYVLSFTVLVLAFHLLAAIGVSQKRKAKRTIQPKPIAAATTKADVPEKVDSTSPPTKRNLRTAAGDSPVRSNQSGKSYVYEFRQPNFINSYIRISHDAEGAGEIRFVRKEIAEEIVEKIGLSRETLTTIDSTLSGLGFLDSSEDYQHQKDFSHLGSVKFRYSDGARMRLVEFNYTDNKLAKTLANEYRNIGNKYIWIFDIGLARDNRPLDAPKLMTVLDGYLRRNEIADPPQMLPFLNELSNDERIPLIARNHAERLVKQIEKEVLRSRK